jgi:hypothetical protein
MVFRAGLKTLLIQGVFMPLNIKTLGLELAINCVKLIHYEALKMSRKTEFLALTITTFALVTLSSCQALKNLSGSNGNCQAYSNAIQTGGGIGLNDSSFGGAVAQSFFSEQGIPALTSVNLALQTNQLQGFGGPTGNLHVAIETSESNMPSGDVLASTSITASTITGTPEFYNFKFDESIDIIANTTYWIVLSADYAINTTNYVIWAGESLNNQPEALYYVSSPGSPDSYWTAATKTGVIAPGTNPGGQQLAFSAGCQ